MSVSLPLELLKSTEKFTVIFKMEISSFLIDSLLFTNPV